MTDQKTFVVSAKNDDKNQSLISTVTLEKALRHAFKGTTARVTGLDTDSAEVVVTANEGHLRTVLACVPNGGYKPAA